MPVVAGAVAVAVVVDKVAAVGTVVAVGGNCPMTVGLEGKLSVDENRPLVVPADAAVEEGVAVLERCIAVRTRWFVVGKGLAVGRNAVGRH